MKIIIMFYIVIVLIITSLTLDSICGIAEILETRINKINQILNY